MPALDDKIFLPISIFVLNIVLAVFKFVLVSAVGACFAIYAKYGGEYANSVGWVRSSGYLEMAKTLKNTSRRKNVPGSVKCALVVALFVTLAASLLDKGISHYVNPAFKPVPRNRTVMDSPQYVLNGFHEELFGWTFTVPSNASVANTMEKALNSSVAILDQPPGRYTPVTKEYNVTCTDFSVTVNARMLRNVTGCGTVDIGFFPTSNNLNITQRSPNRWRIMMEANDLKNNLLDTPFIVSLTNTSLGMWPFSECVLYEKYQNRGWFNVAQDRTALLKSSTTKCFREDGNVTVLAMTAARFNIYPIFRNQYWPDAIDIMFGDPSEELFLSMNETLKGGPMPLTDDQLRNGTSFAAIELRLTNSTLDIFSCGTSLWALNGNGYLDRTYGCVYAISSVLQFTQQPNDDILQRRGGKPYVYMAGDHVPTNYMALEYDGRIIGKNSTKVSIEKMKKDTLDMTDYMAQLGNNFYIDFGEMKLYMQYDFAELVSGLEVPLWVLIVAGIILLISLLVWQLTQWLVGSPHTSSVYSILRHQLASLSKDSVPRLMRFRFEPLMFEDVKLLPDQVERSLDEAKLSPSNASVDTETKTK